MSCKMCGKCCKYLALRVKKEGTDVRWLELHGLNVEDNGDELRVTVVAPCSALKDNKCTIYETRPEVCRNYRCEANILDDFNN